MKNERSSERARFRPSFGIPFRSFVMIGGNMLSVIVRPFRSTPLPSYFFSTSFGFSFAACFSASDRSCVASPWIESGMKFFVLVILRGSASDGLKSSIWDLSSGIDAYAVFSWREYGARKRCLGETRTTSTESSVDLIVISSLNPAWTFFCWTPPNDDVASSFAVLILQAWQKSTSRSLTRFIFALHPGQSIATFFLVGDSSSDLHLLSEQMYL